MSAKTFALRGNKFHYCRADVGRCVRSRSSVKKCADLKKKKGKVSGVSGGSGGNAGGTRLAALQVCCSEEVERSCPNCSWASDELFARRHGRARRMLRQLREPGRLVSDAFAAYRVFLSRAALFSIRRWQGLPRRAGKKNIQVSDDSSVHYACLGFFQVRVPRANNN